MSEVQVNNIQKIATQELVTDESHTAGAVLEFVDVSLKAGDLTILNNLSGYSLPGEMLALMGPSGAGKSSLLNFLSGRNLMLGKAKKSGSVLLNGKKFKKKDKHTIAYVMQQDLFLENLTLGETMRFYEKVKLPDYMSKYEKRTRVMKVLKILEIDTKLQTLIGGVFIRGLSGGEKKRASVAVELLSNPSVIFLDEPTSGLDSGMAYSLITSLQKLCQTSNKTIIASIHQPNSQLFFTFDKLFLLSYGQCHYFGPTANIVKYYQDIKLPCFENWSAADYMLERARDHNLRAQICDSCNEKCDFKLNPEVVKKYSNEENSAEKPQKFISGFPQQYKGLLRRSLYLSVQQSINLLTIIEAVFLGLIAGFLFFKTKFNDAEYFKILSICFYPTSTAFLQPLIINYIFFVQEKVIIAREQSSGIYRLSSYYLSKTLTEFLLLLFRPLVFFTIFYFVAGMSVSVYFLASMGVIILVAFVGQSMGILISSIGLAEEESSLITSLYLILILVNSGIFNRTPVPALSWLRYISPVFHGYSLLLYLQVTANNGIKCVGNAESLVPQCVNSSATVSVAEVLKLESIDLDPPMLLLILVLIGLAARVASYFFLRLTLQRPPISSNLNMKIFKGKSRAGADVGSGEGVEKEVGVEPERETKMEPENLMETGPNLTETGPNLMETEPNLMETEPNLMETEPTTK